VACCIQFGMCASNSNVKPDVVDDPLVRSWLNEFSNPRTRRNYTYGIRAFFNAVDFTPAEFIKLSQREIKQAVLGFQKKLKDEGVADGKISVTTITVRSFLSSQDVVVKFRRNQLVAGGADNSSHVFSNGDLNRLWSVGGAFEKALIACACSQGWEVSMFLGQSRDKIQRRIEHAEQNGVKFVFFMDKRDKTGAERLCVLNPLAIECLKNYFAVRSDDDPRLFPITQDGVQKMLYRLAKDANLKTTGALRFHNIRKWLMSRLSRCNFNEFQIKFVMGKSIGISDGVYLQTLQSEIEEKYPTVYNDYLNICWKPGVSGGQQAFSAEEIDRLKAMLEAFESGEISFKQ